MYGIYFIFILCFSGPFAFNASVSIYDKSMDKNDKYNSSKQLGHILIFLWTVPLNKV